MDIITGLIILLILLAIVAILILMRDRLLDVTVIILGFFFIYGSIYYIGCVFANLFLTHSFSLGFSWKTIFFDEQHLWFYLLTGIATYCWLDVIYVRLFSSKAKGKRGLKFSERSQYSYLASKREMKRGLLRLDFKDVTENGVKKTVIVENTWHDKYLQLVTPLHKLYNKAISHITPEEKYKLPTTKKWNIDGKTVTKRAGLPIIGHKRKLFVDAGDTHSLIIGTTSSGKSWSIVLPMIDSIRLAGESVVINDPKGELYSYTAKQFEDEGYEVKVLNFVDAYKSHCWNPLQIVIDAWTKADEKYKEQLEEWNRKFDEADSDEMQRLMDIKPEADHSQAVELMEDIANILCMSEKSKDPQWDSFAKDMVKGFALFVLEEGLPQYCNFKTIQLLQTLGDQEIRKEHTYLQEYIQRFRRPDSASAMALAAYLDAKGNTKSSMISVFKQKISILTTNEQIMKVTSSNSFDIHDLGNRKMALYLIVHDEKSTYYQLVTIFVKQLYEALINEARGLSDLRLPIPVNLMLDEFGACPAFKDIDKMLAAARSRGIRINMIVQDYEQLNNNYGREIAQTIKGNVMNTVFILSGSTETIQEFSKLCGTQRVWDKSKNQYEDRPVLSLDKLGKLGLGQVVIKRQRWNPFLVKLPPYDKYLFFRGKTQLQMKDIDKPKAEYFDIIEAYKQKTQRSSM